jgi:tetratricopeptide (TPR) repeat protein
MDDMDDMDTLSVARRAAARGEWRTAFDGFMALDADDRLEVYDVPVLAEVAYAAGHLDVAIAAWERVHRSCVEADDRISAAGAAARVAMHLLFDTALMSPVRGWLGRADQFLDGQPDSPALAWCSVVRAYERLLSGDLEAARHWAQRAVEVGSRMEPAAGAIGRVATARLSILDGDVETGLSMLEEVGTTVSGGDLDALSTGVVYCELVCALQGLAQHDLAEEWTEAMERWCEHHAIGSLHGRCRVHRAEILRLRGRLDDAERTVAEAYEELRPYLRRELGWPLAELGEIRRRRGDGAGAGDALAAAHRLGWDPQPGLALLRLAEGDHAAAIAGIRDALDRPMLVPSKERPPDNQLQRAPLLAACVVIEVVGGELDRAQRAAAELEQIADRFRSRALLGAATLARGRVLLAAGEAESARRHLSAAAQLWRDMRAPYELAMTQAELASAHRAMGEEHEAQLQAASHRELMAEISRGSGDDTDDPDDMDGRAGKAMARTPSTVGRLTRHGDYWDIEYGGRTVSIRDLKGLRYLARLFGDPGREFHVLDLVSAENPPPAAESPSARQQRAALDHQVVGETLDEQARTAYRRRLSEIELDIEDARSQGDLGRAARAEAEREFLVRELSSAFGIGGRSRQTGSASERARVSVTRALRTAIGRIVEHHQILGRHLEHSVRTGTYCCYAPDPAHPVRWDL